MCTLVFTIKVWVLPLHVYRDNVVYIYGEIKMADSVYHLLQFHLRIVAASAVSDFLYGVCDVCNP